MDEAARLLGIGKGTAQRAFAELEDKGFLEDRCGRGNGYGRHGDAPGGPRTRLQGRFANERLEGLAASADRPPDVRPETEPSRAGETVTIQIQKEGRMSTCVCLWCQKRFKPRSDGGRRSEVLLAGLPTVFRRSGPGMGAASR